MTTAEVHGTGQLDKVFMQRLVIAESSDGEAWSGTDRWLVRASMPPPKPSTHAMDRVTGQTFDVDVFRVKQCDMPVVAETFYGVLRPYRRADGQVTWLDHAEMSAVERLLEEEDDEGNNFLPPYELRQAGDRWGAVGFFGRDDQLVALAMPVRMINDHLHNCSDHG